MDQGIRAGHEFSGRALGHHLAIGQHHHMVRDLEGFLDVVRDDQAGDFQAVVQTPDQLRGRAQRNRVQPGKGLVVHDEFRVQCDRTGQRHTAAHAAGNFGGSQIPSTTQAHRIELHEHDVADQVFAQIGVLAQREGHVVKHAHVGEQGTELEQHAHAPACGIQLGLPHGTHVLPIEQHLPLLGPVLPANQAQHGGFAAARHAHQGRDLATRHAKTDITQDDPLTISEGEVFQFDKKGTGAVAHEKQEPGVPALVILIRIGLQKVNR